MEFLWNILVSPSKPYSIEILGQYTVISWVLAIIADLAFLWREWTIQVFVLTSFVFQVILILITPFRKKASNVILSISVWVSYLLADWVAILAATFIYKNLENTCEQGTLAQGELFAFWAQFLLVHLGGPDTITALALEDNELWLRTGLHLVTQAYSALGVLVKSIQQSSLWAPTILMFLAGFIKYLERVFSLFHGRLSNSEERLDHYSVFSREPVLEEDTRISLYVPTMVSEIEMVRDALYFFLDFKAHLYADKKFKPDEKKSSRDYFLNRTPEDGFRVLEIELNFSYDAFYTKMIVIHRTHWILLRYLVMVCEAVCLVIWCFSTKNGFGDYNIVITYTLLIGAIAMDVLGLLRIQLSDWNIAGLKKGSGLRSWIYSHWRPRAFSKRWSESVPQMNLISLSVGKRSEMKLKWIKEMIERCRYVTEKGFSTYLRDFIFEYLKESSSVMRPGDCFVDYICYAKGNWAFLRTRIPKGFREMAHLLNRENEYDDILIVWHIVTEICYQDDISKQVQNDERNGDSAKEKYKEISKTLSDYVMYLFLQHPTMMSIVTGNNFSFC